MSQPTVARSRIRTRLIVAVCFLVVALLGAGFYTQWWQPKVEGACNGLPWGPRSVEDATRTFLDGVVTGDTAKVCSAGRNKISDHDLSDLVDTYRTALGNPATTADLPISYGERMGSIVPVTVTGVNGPIELQVDSTSWDTRVLLTDA